MKEMKRVLALVLCFVMVLGLVPASIFTADAVTSDTIYVLAGGDYQEGNADGSTLHENSAENVGNILAQISGAGYDRMDGFLFIGDYDGTDHNNATNVANGITSLMSTVQQTYSNINDANSILVQGNHDNMDSRIDATGGHELDGYAAYVLNEDDYINGGGTEGGVQTLANNMKAWLDIKQAEGYDAPIFVVSHLPLHYSPRTEAQGDAKYAKYLFDVLNEAGEAGLNIIFLHGHDHAYGCDNYLGGEAIYRAEGDSLLVSAVGGGSYTTETLNFTYMNAGYTGYYNESGYNINETDDSKLTMTVFAITGSKVTVERYSADGVYNLASAGRDGSYGNYSASSLGLPYNTTVYASGQEIALTTSSTAEDAGTIGSYVEVAPPVTDDVITSGNGWTTITAPVAGTTTYIYTRADSITARGQYVIVANNQAVALVDNNGSFGSQTVTIDGTKLTSSTELDLWTFSGSNSGTVYNGTRYLWYNNNNFSLNQYQSSTLTFTDNGSNFRIYNDSNRGTDYSFYYSGSEWTRSSNAQYVRLYQLTDTETTNSANGLYGRLEGALSYEVTPGITADEAMQLVKDGITVKYAYAASEPDASAGETFEDDGQGMTWEWVDTFDGSTPGDYAIRISYNGVELGTAEVVVPAQSTYYIAEGKGLYAVSMNTTADNALAYVKEGVAVYSATDANGSNKTLVDDTDVTWTWVDTYDGTNNGPYTVDIRVDDVSLGTVEVKVDVRYESGLADGWIDAGTSAPSYRYVLDTDGYETGSNNKYLFVASNAAYAMDEDGSGVVPVTFNTGETEAIVDSRDYEWYITTYQSGRTTYYPVTKNGSTWIYHENYGMHVGTNDNGYWSINENDQDEGLYRFSNVDGSTWYLYYDSADRRMEVSTSSSNRVRLYKYDGEIAGGNQFVKLEGNTLYAVPVGTSTTAAMNTVKEGLTAYISSNADGSDPEILDDSKLTWKWKNTFNGQTTGSYFVEISYNGVSLGIVEVVVEPGVVNNYPEYPKEGAVKVNKTATGIDFQASGVAQIEISASGVPAKKGADVIVMLDTSSSMTNENYLINGVTRAEVLEESLKDLIAAFKADGDDGEPLDIRVAIADFNGFYGDNQSESGTPYDRDAEDMLSDDISYDAASEARVYTNTTNALDYTAFVNAQDLAASYTLNYTSGTNYDYAMDAIYQMGASVKAQNEINGEERDLYVIFMSDGAAMQWNYYHSNGRSTDWQYWITGAWAADTISTHLNCTDHAYYYRDDVDGDGYVNEHRMADAIKGDPTQRYEVIRKSTENIDDIQEASSGLENMYTVPGLGATMFAIAFDPQTDQNTPPEAMEESIKTLASDQVGTTQYYYRVETADELTSAFNSIGSEVAYAANNARFVDQMGDSFNLQIGNLQYLPTGVNDESQKETIVPYIEILSYDIYTRADYEAGTIAEDQIGVRKGDSTLLELVAFNADGTAAYSSLIDVDGDGTMGLYDITENTDGTYTFKIDEDDNIMDANKVIWARTFYYNAGVQSAALEGVSIPTGINADGTTSKATTNVLPSETFYWKLGTVQTSELAMRYFVYLEGSLEGTMPGGSYATNEFATLYYDNYLGNPCYKDTVSPQLGWKEANVSYAFYLVNAEGKIITNQATGATGTFANKVAVTNPVVYDTINLNNEEDLRALEVAAIEDDVLPKYYTLYDQGAVYKVNVNSNSTGSWQITNGGQPVDTTYVTNHTIGTAYSNALTENNTQYDYTHTVVWFAVVWNIEAHPDAVVVDYGLPVDIDVLSNDMFGSAGKLNSISNTIPWQTNDDGTMYYDQYGKQQVISGHDAAPREGFVPSITTQFGTATVDVSTNKVTYQLNKTNGMQMNTVDQFAYAVQYTGSENAGYYYDVVTIIPATTIYYEESFLTFSGSGTRWTDAGSAVTGGKQDEDRPGAYSLSDANNIYGYDSVNMGLSQFSLGTAKQVHVGEGTYATATFSFIGTGFDVISMTSSSTGVIAVQVVNASGTTVEAKVVNTYYGAQYNESSGKWDIVADGAENTPNQIWQVPVLQVEGLDYGSYTVTITATYAAPLDKTAAEGYDLYLDAIRIYNPAGTEYGSDDTADGTIGNLIHSEIQSAYAADGERWPTYYELRNMILTANSFDDAAENLGGMEEDRMGVVFIDGDSSVGDDQIADYTSYGPNNEIYLLPGQRVAFILSDAQGNIDKVHIGISSADGAAASYTITNIAANDIANSTVKAGDYYNAKTSEVDTTTDMYYDMTAWKGDIIVISNTGDRYNTTGVIALTNIKVTHIEAPSGTGAPFRMTRSAAMLTLASLNAAEPVEETIGGGNVPVDNSPETNVPETNAPEDNTPETDAPEDSTPETSVPEDSTPETSVPEVSTPEDSAPETNTPEGGDTVTGETTAPATPEDTEQNKPTENTPAEDDIGEATPEEAPEEDTPAEDESMEEETTEQLGFWARLWNAIKNAFKQMLAWFGF